MIFSLLLWPLRLYIVVCLLCIFDVSLCALKKFSISICVCVCVLVCVCICCVSLWLLLVCYGICHPLVLLSFVWSCDSFECWINYEFRWANSRAFYVSQESTSWSNLFKPTQETLIDILRYHNHSKATMSSATLARSLTWRSCQTAAKYQAWRAPREASVFPL